MAATGHERAAHEGDRRPCKHRCQVTQTVEQQHSPGSEVRLLGAAHQGPTCLAYDAFDLVGALRITRRQYERNQEPCVLRREKRSQRGLLLARMGAASDEKRTVGEPAFELGRE